MRLCWVAWLTLAVLAASCKEEEKAPSIPGGGNTDNTAGKKGSGNRDSGMMSEDPDAGGGPGAPSEGPMLEFSSLERATDPDDDTVITSPQLTVRCKVSRRSGHADVDRSTVAITLEDPRKDGDVIAPPVDALADGEHEADFELGALPNGPLRFRCEASDAAATPASNALAVSTLLDLGPSIEFKSPVDGDKVALATPVAIEFYVRPQPLAEDDEEAEIESVILRALNLEIPVERSDDDPTLYTTSVDFDDSTLFALPPKSAELVVEAKNRRTPMAAERTGKVAITVDGQGPVISVVSPPAGDVRRGKVDLVINVTDDSGVDEGSLRATTINVLEVKDWTRVGSVFTGSFDTVDFSPNLTQITLQITAADTVGNRSVVAHTLRIDNFPPVLSLDPPVIREYVEVAPNYYCSTAFDPVGENAVDDKERATVSAYFRVLIEDNTGTTLGQMFDYSAGVKSTSVELYAQQDVSKPFLIDTNADGKCDEIALREEPDMADRPQKINLSVVDPRGSAWYPPSGSSAWEAIDRGHDILLGPRPDGSGGGFCGPNPAGPVLEPDTLCPSSEMTRAVRGRGESKPPALYALMPTNGGLGECTGTFWQVLPLVGEGWRCLAARAEDNAGNVGISAPLRVCFDDFEGSAPDCNVDNAPSCTSDCTIQADQLFKTNDYWPL
jgi:hypothetical protein